MYPTIPMVMSQLRACCSMREELSSWVRKRSSNVSANPAMISFCCDPSSPTTNSFFRGGRTGRGGPPGATTGATTGGGGTPTKEASAAKVGEAAGAACSCNEGPLSTSMTAWRINGARLVASAC